ncbi:MAG: response regulator transcription factor [Elusimicrobiota bacterium]
MISLVGDKKLCAGLGRLLKSQDYQFLSLESAGSSSISGAAPIIILAENSDLESAKKNVLHYRSGGSAENSAILCVCPEMDRRESILLLEAGADDVIHSPFDGRIFLARTGALIRRGLRMGILKNSPPQKLSFGPVSIDIITRRALAQDEELSLSRMEFDLLAFFLKNPDSVQTRTSILKAVWGYPEEVQTRTLDKHVESLRRKMGAAGNFIRTVHVNV